LRVAEWILAPNVYILRLTYFVPEFFHPNRASPFPASIRRLTFSADRNARMLSLRGAGWMAQPDHLQERAVLAHTFSRWEDGLSRVQDYVLCRLMSLLASNKLCIAGGLQNIAKTGFGLELK
jgi:hypothetical protein